MDDRFKIYLSDLAKGNVEVIKESFDPDFIEINEEELTFREPVFVEGEAYLAVDELILRFHVNTVAQMPCSICNQLFNVPIDLPYFYTNVSLSDISSGIF